MTKIDTQDLGYDRGESLDDMFGQLQEFCENGGGEFARSEDSAHCELRNSEFTVDFDTDEGGEVRPGDGSVTVTWEQETQGGGTMSGNVDIPEWAFLETGVDDDGNVASVIFDHTNPGTGARRYVQRGHYFAMSHTSHDGSIYYPGGYYEIHKS